MRFDGKTVVVTGVSRGIGRTIALAFVREGARVVGTFRTHANEAATLRVEAGESLTLVPLDVRDGGAVDRLVHDVCASHGTIDVLINNAGINSDAPLLMLDDDDLASVMSVNFAGTARMCRSVVRKMLARRRGAIVNLGSIAGIRANPTQIAYGASKAAILALTRTLAVEVAAHGVRVNAVIPGLIRAGMAERMDHAIRDRIAAHIPMQRMGTAEDVAHAVLFLASDEASYITGTEVHVDGGLTA